MPHEIEEIEERAEKLRRICETLSRAYGEKELVRRDPIETLIRTILSHNTNDKNCDAAFKNLTAKFRYEELLTASEDEIADAIRTAGLSRVKAKRIKNALNFIKQHCERADNRERADESAESAENAESASGASEGASEEGASKGASEKENAIDMRFLEGMSLEEGRRFLTRIPGIGQKTASCILCFSFGKGAFPIDTHIRRIFRRIFNEDLDAREIERSIPAEKIYEFHLNLIEHGRKVCKARKPLCDECVLREECAYSLRVWSVGIR